MGSVFLVEDRSLERAVALKTLDLTGPHDEHAHRLLEEARVLARLEHPGIVPVHEVGTLGDGRLFYTMKYVEGRRLDEHVRDVPALTDRLRLFLRICETVEFAHARGVLHRDLKPENIMIGAFGEVLVMDWGIARVLERGIPEDGSVFGTPGFMAPEQATGRNSCLDARADVYSLGAILRTLASADPSTPRPLAAVIAKARSPEPDDRYRDAGLLGRDIARFLDGLPPLAYPDTGYRRAKRFISRHLAWILLVAAYLVMRAVLIFWPRH